MDNSWCFEEYIVGILLTLSSAFLYRLHTTAEEVLTDESRTSVEGFTVETVTAEELHFYEADDLTTDASLTKPNSGMFSD